MSVLSKIRENVGLVIILIAISLAAFILTDLFRGISGGGNDNSVGTVAGEKVDFNRYAQQIDELQRRYGSGLSSEQEYQLRQQAWETLVNEMAYQKEYDELGIMVSEDEISQMYLGPWVHRFVRQIPYFTDPATGQYNADTVRRRLQLASQIDLNNPAPEYQQLIPFKLEMIDNRRAIITDRTQQKYNSMILGGIFTTTNEVKRRNAAENKKVSFSYVSVPYSDISDDQVTVTDADYSDYYNKVKEQFKQEMNVTIRYAAFPLIPSKKDSAGTLSEVARVKMDFQEQDSADLIQYTLSNSDGLGVDTSYKTMDQLPAEIANGIIAYGMDTVFGPTLDATAGTYNLSRITDSRKAAAKVAKARHILVRIEGTTAEDTAKARQKANDLRRQANSENFAELAKENSNDFTTQTTGGLLGWIAPGTMGPNSADWDKQIGEREAGSIYVAQSARGFHVVEILATSDMAYQVMTIQRNISPGFTTIDSVSKLANQFAGTAASTGSLDSAQKDFATINVLTSQPLTAATNTLAGVDGARPVITWALGANEGDLMEKIIQTENAFVIAKVTSKVEKGYMPLEKAKDRIRKQVYDKKKADLIKAKMSGTDLNAIAAANSKQVLQSPGISFYIDPANPQAVGVAAEHLVVGAAFSLQQGQVSKPIAGNGGVYVIRVDNIQEAQELPAEMIAARKAMLTQAKREAALQKFYMGLRDVSDIEDRRYMRNY